MLKKIITLILIGFMSLPQSAKADQPTRPAAEASSETAAQAATMNDSALASYISGRLKNVLKDQGYSVAKSCDDTGCSVVVQ